MKPDHPHPESDVDPADPQPSETEPRLRPPLPMPRVGSIRGTVALAAAFGPALALATALLLTSPGVLIGAVAASFAAVSIGGAIFALRFIRQLQSGVYIDALTGLHNRHYFDDQLAAALSAARRMGSEVAVLMVDVDRFKDVNDAYGHHAGDLMLQEVSRRLAASVRPYDTLARYGGEEFGVVLPLTEEAGVAAVAERLRRAIAERPFEVASGINVSCTISIGFSMFPDDSGSGEELVHRADLALYTCKRYGRNQLRRCGTNDMSVIGVQRHRELIDALAAIVDLRDGATGQHTREVSRWSQMLAEELGLDPVSVGTIEAAALVHDIGKVGVPDGILQKPAQLDSSEWRIIEEHPGWGADIVGRVSNMERVALIVRQHQEWVDGTGYPNQLKDDEIDIGARIVGVVDAYHSMTTDRPYRKAMTQEAAIAELDSGAGSQFDAACVRAFQALIQHGRIGVGDSPARPAGDEPEAAQAA